jgi:hypothetical protein
LLAVFCLADDFDIGLAVEDDAEAAAYERLVVGDQDADQVDAPFSGMRAWTWNPPVSRGPLVSVPP